MAKSVVAIVPNARYEAARSAMEAAGYGPHCFARRVRQSPNATDTHRGLEVNNATEEFITAIQGLNVSGMIVSIIEDGQSGREHFLARLQANNMVMVDTAAT